MPLELVDRLSDDTGVVFGEPVPKEIVRDLYSDGVALVQEKRGWFEPRVEAVAVDFRLDESENLAPHVFGRPGTQIGHLEPASSCAAGRETAGACGVRCAGMLPTGPGGRQKR